MKYLGLIIMFCSCINCRAQSFPNYLKAEIVDFYISLNEIQEKDKDRMIENFEELFTIKELGNDSSKFSNKSVGIYKLSPNITHTTTNLLACNGENCKVLSVDNGDETLGNAIKFIKEYDAIDKRKALLYVEAIVKLLKDNEELKRLDVLEFKEN
jgi:hypothetical protein